MRKLVTIAEAADRLGLSAWTVRRWASSRRIRSFKLGRRRMLAEEDLRALVAAGERPARSDVALPADPTTTPEPTSAEPCAIERRPSVAVYELQPNALDEGEKLCRLWMELLLNCERSGDWPGYGEAVLPLEVFSGVELDWGDDSE